jgi:hypothetical protein
MNAIEHGQIYRQFNNEFQSKLLEIFNDFNLGYCIPRDEFLNSYKLDYNIIYTSKAQTAINKHKKKKTKLNIKYPLKNDKEVQKKTILRKSPECFENHYKYFAYICNTLKCQYYKYQSSCHWIGPALIINNKPKIIQYYRKKIKIPLNIDIISHDTISLFPQNKCDVNCIHYSDNYNVEERQYEVEVIEWEHNKRIYHLDTQTNNVYDPDTDFFIGRRDFKTKTKLWYINENVDEEIT